MILFQSLPALAADNDWQNAAEYLYELGLFRGTGTDSGGAPVFELERSPNRSEALVMVLRLMGLEEEALSSDYSHPFTDSSEWNEPYIAYAYNKGLTMGVSKTRFGANEPATAQMYITFVLRCLGYTDSGNSPDFSYSGSVSFAADIGLVDSGFSDYTNFTRGDVAIISRNALSQPLRNSEQTLYQKLVDNGVIKASAPYWNEDKTALMLPAEYHEGKGFVVSFKTLSSLFPETAKVLYTTATSEETYSLSSDRYSAEELQYIDALSNEKHYERLGWANGDIVRVPPVTTLYLVDKNYNILAKCAAPKQIVDSCELIFTTQVKINGERLNADYRKIIDTVSQNWGKNLFELSEERYNPYGDISDYSNIRFVKMNGSYISNEWYCVVSSYASYFEYDPIEEAERIMTLTFFYSAKKLQEDGSWISFSFDEKFGYIKNVDDPAAPASRGFWLAEHSSVDRVIYFFTRDGVYLGQIYLPPG